MDNDYLFDSEPLSVEFESIPAVEWTQQDLEHAKYLRVLMAKHGGNIGAVLTELFPGRKRRGEKQCQQQ
jgi:hypothetical protein